MKLALAHVTLPVTDLAVAEAFYVDLLGARLARRFDRATFVASRPDRAHEADAPNSPLHLALSFGPPEPELQLFLQPEGEPSVERPHPHVAFAVEPDALAELVTALLARGIPVEGPLRLGPPGQASVYFFDPFGNHLELTAQGYRGDAPLALPDMKKLVYRWTT
jgi:catechol 2,3-dioxygenase-like lactoylglutathione lyase family enzyme